MIGTWRDGVRGNLTGEEKESFDRYIAAVAFGTSPSSVKEWFDKAKDNDTRAFWTLVMQEQGREQPKNHSYFGIESVHSGYEVRHTDPETGGQKGVKPERYDLIPFGSLAEVARLYGRGAEKYAEHNWRKGYDWSKSFSALQRHAWAFWSGEDDDEETGVSHMANVVFHAFALMEFVLTHPEKDDRFKSCN